MDVYCTNCGEPWDALECDKFARRTAMLPEHANTLISDLTGEQRTAIGDPRSMIDLALDGECLACNGEKQEGRKPFRAHVTSILHDLLGDDIDGLAVELEDVEYMLGSEFQEHEL